jgi:hypothetical protein
MGILTRTDPQAEVQRLHRELLDVRRELRDTQTECRALRDQLEGRKDHMWWVQAKVYAQAKANNRMQRTVENQRFVLRTLEQLGRSLTRDEFVAARDEMKNDQLKERIDVPSA